MKRLLLTAYGFSTEEIKNAFYRMYPEKSEVSRIVIISTSQPELKEKHPQMISVKKQFQEMGFNNIDFVDIEFESSNKLKEYDVIFLNGGYPFYLIHHLKKSGADTIINEMIELGTIVIGLSAGSIALGPDNEICNYIFPEANTFKDEDMSALNAIDLRIYPHFREHCNNNPIIEDEVLRFERIFKCDVTRLDNSQAILVLGDEVEKIG